MSDLVDLDYGQFLEKQGLFNSLRCFICHKDFRENFSLAQHFASGHKFLELFKMRPPPNADLIDCLNNLKISKVPSRALYIYSHENKVHHLSEGNELTSSFSTPDERDSEDWPPDRSLIPVRPDMMVFEELAASVQVETSWG